MRFQEIFPPRPTMDVLGMEARRQAFSAMTGKVLQKGIIPSPEMLPKEGVQAMPTVFGYPDIFSAMDVRRNLRKRGPTLDLLDVDGVVFDNSEEQYSQSGLRRIIGSNSVRSVLSPSWAKDHARIPQREEGTDESLQAQATLAISRSFSFWPRQEILRTSFGQEMISFIDSFDRHHPPSTESKKPKIWQVFERKLMELVKPLELDGKTLNFNHYGDIIPPIAPLAGNEGVVIHWLSKFFTGIGIQTNPNLTFINPVFPKGGMILDPNTFEFLPLRGAEV